MPSADGESKKANKKGKLPKINESDLVLAFSSSSEELDNTHILCSVHSINSEESKGGDGQQV